MNGPTELERARSRRSTWEKIASLDRSRVRAIVDMDCDAMRPALEDALEQARKSQTEYEIAAAIEADLEGTPCTLLD